MKPLGRARGSSLLKQRAKCNNRNELSDVPRVKTNEHMQYTHQTRCITRNTQTTSAHKRERDNYVCARVSKNMRLFSTLDAHTTNRQTIRHSLESIVESAHFGKCRLDKCIFEARIASDLAAVAGRRRHNGRRMRRTELLAHFFSSKVDVSVRVCVCTRECEE